MAVDTEPLLNTSNISLKVLGRDVIADSNNSDLTLIPCRARSSFMYKLMMEHVRMERANIKGVNQKQDLQS